MADRVAPPGASALSGRLVSADNLPVLGLLRAARCTLVHADLPFSTAKTIRGSGGSAGFVDSHEGGHSGYLDFLRPRLNELVRLLNNLATLYVYLAWRVVRYGKVLLDELLSSCHLLNEILALSERMPVGPVVRAQTRYDSGVHQIAPDREFNRLMRGPYGVRDLSMDEDGQPFKSTWRGRVYFHRDGPAQSDVLDLFMLSAASKEAVGERRLATIGP